MPRRTASALRFTRNLGSIVMDADDIEVVDLNALGGAGTITANDLTGTDVVELDGDLAGTLDGTAGDVQPDMVIVNGTNGAATPSPTTSSFTAPTATT